MNSFDATIAIAQAGGNEQLARDLFAMLLKELPEHSITIQQAFCTYQSNPTNYDIIRDPVHKLYGATAYLGVPAIRHSCKELEDSMKNDNLIQIQYAVDQLLHHIEKLSQFGEDILRQKWS